MYAISRLINGCKLHHYGQIITIRTQLLSKTTINLSRSINKSCTNEICARAVELTDPESITLRARLASRN